MKPRPEEIRQGLELRIETLIDKKEVILSAADSPRSGESAESKDPKDDCGTMKWKGISIGLLAVSWLTCYVGPFTSGIC